MHPVVLVGGERAYYAHPHEAGALAALNILSDSKALNVLRLRANFGECPIPPSCLTGVAPLQHIQELQVCRFIP